MGSADPLIQSNDTMMAEKIQTTIVNTIPLWKNQMVLALALPTASRPWHAERRDRCHERAAEKERRHLKQGTIEIAKESERGIVDIETLQQTNKQLIETLDELNKIGADGKAKARQCRAGAGPHRGRAAPEDAEINS